jgi:hypothetical protein
MYQVTRAKALCDSMGLTYKVAAINFIQGESDSTDPSWHTAMIALCASINSGIKTITGEVEDIVFTIEQMNRPVWTVAQAVDLSIIQAHHGDSGRIYLQGSRLDYNMSNHYYPHGKRRRGCSMGETLVDILGYHEEWEPVSVKSWSINGTDLFLRYNVPVEPLQFLANDRSGLITNYGFEVSSGTISTVTIEHDDLIRVRLASGTWPSKTLKYGRQAGLGAEKGNVCDSTATVAIYNDASAVPYNLRNQSIAFELTI